MPIETPHDRTILGRRARLLLVLAAAAAVILIAVPGAQAATFCVGAPANCSGMDLPGEGGALQEALSTAAANGEQDLVRIGAGTYTPAEPGGWEFNDPVHGIEIRGEGSDRTILQGSGLNATTLKLTGVGPDASSVAELGLRLSSGGGSPTGLALAGASAAKVAVTAPPGLAGGRGVRLAGGYTSFAEGSVNVPGLTGVEASGDANVGMVSIVADVGVMSTSGDLWVVHSRIETSRIGIISSAPTHLTDTVVHVTDGAGTEYGVLGTGGLAGMHLTVVGTAGPSYGVRAYRVAGGTASIDLDNSTITGFDDDLSAGADAISLANIKVDYSNFATTLAAPGGAINLGSGNVNLVPGFADAVGGNFHLRHDSLLIDRGADIGQSNSEGDLDGLPRFVDGDGSGGAEPDIGAYEYQHAAPVATIGGPATGTAGVPLDLSGARSSDLDGGDSLTNAWSFGDGGVATGPTAAHSYSAPGTYLVTLRVTDPTGQQAMATKEITVGAPAAGPTGGGATSGGGETTGAGGTTPAATDALAPVISRLRAARAGKGIRFRLSEPARVTLRLRPVGTGGVAKRIPLNGRSGANLVRLRGGLAKTLRPGRYRVTASARDAAGNRARPRVARLLLLRR